MWFCFVRPLQKILTLTAEAVPAHTVGCGGRGEAFFLMCIGNLPVHLCEGVRFPGTGVADSCELLCGVGK
jgi:hypothetical protein